MTPVVPFVATLVIVPTVAESVKPSGNAGVAVPKEANGLGVTVMVEVVPAAPTVAPEFTVAGRAVMVMTGGATANVICARVGLAANPGFARHVNIVTDPGAAIGEGAV